MRGRGRLCAVTQITKDNLGFRDLAHRLATYVVGNVRKGLNCGKEVYRMKSTDMESRLTRVVSSSGQTRSRSSSVVLPLKFPEVKNSTVGLGHSSQNRPDDGS